MRLAVHSVYTGPYGDAKAWQRSEVSRAKMPKQLTSLEMLPLNNS